MHRLDVGSGENAVGRDMVQGDRRAQASDHERSLIDTVAAFELVRNFSDVQPAHPRTLGVECPLNHAGGRLVTVEPRQHRPRVQAYAHRGSRARSSSSAAAKPLEA